jgi:hypothetical protein
MSEGLGTVRVRRGDDGVVWKEEVRDYCTLE